MKERPEIKKHVKTGAALAAGLFILYALTASRTVTLEDSGEFILTSHFWGAAHPPGYPLYTLLGKFFSLLPFGSAAYRLHLMSALSGALASAALYLCAIKFNLSRFAAAMAALLYGTSLTFWSQSIVAEVYSLNMLFFLTLLFLTLDLRERFAKFKFFVFCLIFGLSLSNHWPLILLASPILIVFFWGQRQPALRLAIPGAAMFVVGLLPYAVLYGRSHSAQDMVFSGPIEGLGGLLDFVVRKDYMAMENSESATLFDSILFFGRFLAQSVKEFAYFGAALILAGGYYLKDKPFAVKFAFIWGVLSSSLLLKSFEVNDFEPINVQTYLIYQLTPYAFFALLIGLAIHQVSIRNKKWAWGISIAALGATLLVNGHANDMRNDTLALDYAKAVLEPLPQNAKLFVYSESDANPIAYARHLESIRPDVTVYSQLGLLFSNRIFDPNHPVARVKGSKTKAFFVSNAPVFLSAPLFFIGEQDLAPLTVKRFGLGDVVSAEPLAADDSALVARAQEILDRQMTNGYRGPWRYHSGFIYSALCRLLARNGVDHSFINQSPTCKLEYAMHRFRSGDFAGAEKLSGELLAQEQFLNKAPHSQLVNMHAQAEINLLNSRLDSPAARQAAYQEVAERLLRFARAFPSCSNAVVPTLLRLRKDGGVAADISPISKALGTCPEFNGLW